MYQLSPKAQNYEWGKIGHDSIISYFYNNIDSNKPYAELWMGTHKKAESKVIVNNEKILLSEHLNKNLPFLFKILSINKALSIQVHPDKKTAERLNRERGDVYVDDNHKPEMFYTLSDFEALCGFRDNKEITEFIKIYHREFRRILDVKDLFISDDTKLKIVFSKIMKADKSIIKLVIQDIILYITKLKNPEFEKLFIRINNQYPYDVGVLSLFFLNYLKLPKGEVIYLKANVPHAYLSGDCLEIMATSDNVIRCGLTPKFRDVDLLCEILDYSYKYPKSVKSKMSKCGLFEPIKDFGLMILENKKNDNSYWEICTDLPLIMLVLYADKNTMCNGNLITTGSSYIMEDSTNEFQGKCKVVFAYKPREYLKVPPPPPNTPVTDEIPKAPSNTPEVVLF